MRHEWAKFKVSDTQNFRWGKAVSYQFCSEIYGLQEQMGVTDFLRMARPKAVKICTTEPGGLFKGEDIGVDVQELTESIENMNAKSLNYWLSMFVQEVANKSARWYISRTLYSIFCGLKCFLVEKNGEGALSPLAVSDKRYHFDWFWKILFVLCILISCNLCYILSRK